MPGANETALALQKLRDVLLYVIRVSNILLTAPRIGAGGHSGECLGMTYARLG